MLGDQRADNLLADARRIIVAGVDQVDAGVRRAAEHRAALLQRQHPGPPGAVAEAHGAECKTRDLQAALAETHVVHHVCAFHTSRKRGIWSGIHSKPRTSLRSAPYSAPNSSGTIGRSVTTCCWISPYNCLR